MSVPKAVVPGKSLSGMESNGSCASSHYCYWLASFRQACASRFRSRFLLFQQSPYRCSTDFQPLRNLRFADSCEKQVHDGGRFASGCRRSAESLALRPRVLQTRPRPFPHNIPFKLGECFKGKPNRGFDGRKTDLAPLDGCVSNCFVANAGVSDTLTQSYGCLLDVGERSDSIRYVKISLIRVKWPLPLDLSHSTTAGSSRTLTGTFRWGKSRNRVICSNCFLVRRGAPSN